MLSFECDYLEGCHEAILQALVKSNNEQLSGYGSDCYTVQAKEKIKEACGCPQGDVYFLSGGTQTNQIVINSMLQSYEGVVAAETGHVSVHEAGAIEFSGHKVVTIPSHLGKIDVAELSQYVENFYNDGNHEHMVFPGMVYISQPTEHGTLYTLDELTGIREICDKHQMHFFIDGARLGYGLALRDADVTLQDIARLSDVFYIGGTKIGALIGEGASVGYSVQ